MSDHELALKIRLPWLPRECSPNARLHWTRRARAAKKYRAACMWEAQRQGIRELRGLQELCMALAFYPPDRRRRDDDNLLAAFKPGRDGLADALGIDDQAIRIASVYVRDPVDGGSVVVKLFSAYTSPSSNADPEHPQ